MISSRLIAPTGEETSMALQQVNGRYITTFPAQHVMEFRSPRVGTLTKIELFSPTVLTNDCTLDVNLGQHRGNLTTIYPDQSKRPVIPGGSFKAVSEVSVDVMSGDLISVDIDAAGDNIKLLTVTLTIE